MYLQKRRPSGMSSWAERHGAEQRAGNAMMWPVVIFCPARSRGRDVGWTSWSNFFILGIPNDYHAFSIANLAGRRRDGFAFVLSPTWWLSYRRRDRQIRLYHRPSAIRGGFSPQVFPSGGSIHDRRNQTPDYQGSAQAGRRAGTQSGDRQHGRYPGGN